MAVLRTEVFLYERAVILISCFLSFLGSCLIIFTYMLWADLRTKPRKLLVFLSVADLLSAVSYFYGVLRDFDSDSWDCVLQGSVSTFANTSSFFWTVAVAIYLYIFIVRSDQRTANGLLLWFHIISWCVPLGITIAAVSLQKIGYDASNVSVGWCWVSINASDQVLWMLLTGKVWEILAYITLPILYILIKKHIKTAHAALSEYRPILAANPMSQFQSSMADTKLTLIPVIFIALRIWSTIRFVLTLAESPAVQNPMLVILHGVGNTFQGGANCIMFVLCTQVVRSRLASALCCCRYEAGCTCCRGSNSNQQPVETPRTEELPVCLG
ncbi:G-protein coupled receptor 157-like isoform X1 [Huso huso]|uniref:G-protein coupled receptor 157-like isoform X1 n=1 Tax=Huso huso TaxID=61971 RepID=A0ABR0YIG9_HUSHU